jgi:hypothetical protein
MKVLLLNTLRQTCGCSSRTICSFASPGIDFRADGLCRFNGAQAKDQAAAKELLNDLSSADAAKVYKERGMVVARGPLSSQ